MELIKDNYLFGTGSGSTWKVTIEPPKRKIKTYYEETVVAIEYINDIKIGNFQVLLSGGLDSQYVCEVLLKMGIKFQPVIIEVKDDDNNVYNYHDIKYAYEFCKSKNINPLVFPVKFHDFIESGENVKIAIDCECSSFVLPTWMHVISKLDGFTLLGSDPPYIKRIKDGHWVLEEMQYTHSWLRFYEKNNLNGCPFLLSYTSEMMLSFLLDPMIVKLGTDKLVGKTGSNSTKSYVFNNGSDFNMPVYDFVTKSRIKFTGFENIVASKIMNHPNLRIFQEFKKQWNGEYIEPYTSLIKRLMVHQ